jgi:hypothetical protein
MWEEDGELCEVLLRGILRLPAEHVLQMFDDRMKCARRVKGEAAHRHPNVVLAARLSQRFQQTGLADPGFPSLDQHDRQLPSQARNSSPISSWRQTRGAELPARVAANRLSTSRAEKPRHAGTGSANPLSSSSSVTLRQ